ncbi:hypothetical protein BS47DRAFT_1487083 [Hydnum rufescens UP504]|uniref:Uncharacterized protein n=1 Tax=Hydnum rufescens UP504 TaxID=1448309 RepID=A0A9P6AS87_9AGAM|nr:hypothetical protein BS47DRAFT_1487083 [Hydnum rufescens UP504]
MDTTELLCTCTSPASCATSMFGIWMWRSSWTVLLCSSKTKPLNAGRYYQFCKNTAKHFYWRTEKIDIEKFPEDHRIKIAMAESMSTATSERGHDCAEPGCSLKNGKPRKAHQKCSRHQCRTHCLAAQAAGASECVAHARPILLNSSASVFTAAHPFSSQTALPSASHVARSYSSPDSHPLPLPSDVPPTGSSTAVPPQLRGYSRAIPPDWGLNRAKPTPTVVLPSQEEVERIHKAHVLRQITLVVWTSNTDGPVHIDLDVGTEWPILKLHQHLGAILDAGIVLPDERIGLWHPTFDEWRWRSISTTEISVKDTKRVLARLSTVQTIDDVVFADERRKLELASQLPISKRPPSPVVNQHPAKIPRNSLSSTYPAQFRHYTSIGDHTSLLGDRMSSAGDHASSVGDRASLVGDRVGLVGDRTSLVGDRAGSVGDRAGSVGDRASSVGDEFGWRSREFDWRSPKFVPRAHECIWRSQRPSAASYSGLCHNRCLSNHLCG